MIAVLLALCASIGVHLLYGVIVLGQRSIFSGDGRSLHRIDSRFSELFNSKFNDWLAQAGLGNIERRQLVLLIISLFTGGILVGWLVFGGLVAPLVVGSLATTAPVAIYRQRRQRRLSEASEAWPRMIEEIRLLCGSLGRPIPQALLEVGRRGPVELRDAFEEAEREWLISTDFSSTISVLKERLADPTADATCETLLVAHALGGSDVDRRLAALADDRNLDLQGRKDARAKQAGVRFARRFVLIVPIGMAFAGMSIGNGRAAYATTQGQIAVTVAIITLAGCWWWAGRLIRLPQEGRVFRA